MGDFYNAFIGLDTYNLTGLLCKIGFCIEFFCVVSKGVYSNWEIKFFWESLYRIKLGDLVLSEFWSWEGIPFIV